MDYFIFSKINSFRFDISDYNSNILRTKYNSADSKFKIIFLTVDLKLSSLPIEYELSDSTTNSIKFEDLDRPWLERQGDGYYMERTCINSNQIKVNIYSDTLDIILNELRGNQIYFSHKLINFSFVKVYFEFDNHSTNCIESTINNNEREDKRTYLVAIAPVQDSNKITFTVDSPIEITSSFYIVFRDEQDRLVDLNNFAIHFNKF